MPRMIESPTRFRFTQKVLEALPPHDPDSRSAQHEVSDTECIGLRLNTSKSGRKWWFLRARWRGGKKAFLLGEFSPSMGLKQARERAWEVKAMLSRGEDPTATKTQQDEVPTFSAFAEQYLENAKARVRRLDVIISRLNTGALPYFKDVRIDAITTRHVQQFHTKMREKVSPTTANHHLVLIRAMLNWAVRVELIEKNPCRGVKKFQEPTGRDRYLSNDEVKRFFAALEKCANVPVVSGLRLLVFSGLRSREVFDLRWQDIDVETHSIRLVKTKSGKARRVNLSSAAWAEIERMQALRRGDHPFVFPGRAPNTPVMQPHNAFRGILKEAKISDFRIHDLRHTFASHMAQSGATLLEISRSLGHASQTMSLRYSHLSDSGLRERAEQAALHLTGESDEAPRT